MDSRTALRLLAAVTALFAGVLALIVVIGLIRGVVA